MTLWEFLQFLADYVGSMERRERIMTSIEVGKQVEDLINSPLWNDDWLVDDYA